MLAFLKHWLTPHRKNNHRAKILHSTSILGVVVILLFASISLKLIKTSHPEVLGVSYSISENELIASVNSERAKNGLSPLTMNAQLSDAARRKASDMFAKNYWAHFSPDGSTTPWQFIRSAGYDYQFAGENLAKGFTDSGSVVNAWMNSPTHRENLLSNKYHDVGFAIVPGVLQGEETVLVVQMFGETPAEANVDPVVVSSSNAEEVVSVPEIPEVPEGAILPKSDVKSVESNESKVVSKPIVDSASASKAILYVILAFIVLGLFLDALIVERNKIPRFVGHNLDHIIVISVFVLFLVIMESGAIL